MRAATRPPCSTGIPTTSSSRRKFGFRAFYGDATRLDLLHAAGAANAKLLIVTLDDPDAATRLVKIARKHFPAAQDRRARTRHAAHVRAARPGHRGNGARDLALGAQARRSGALHHQRRRGARRAARRAPSSSTTARCWSSSTRCIATPPTRISASRTACAPSLRARSRGTGPHKPAAATRFNAAAAARPAARAAAGPAPQDRRRASR